MAPEGRLWGEVADRGADTTEFLDFEEAQGKKYVVRSQHNRWVLPGHDRPAERVKIQDWLGSLAEAGRRQVEGPARDGQPARTATVAVAWAPLRVLPPRQRRGMERGTPLAVWAVRVGELDPPAAVKEPLACSLARLDATAYDG